MTVTDDVATRPIPLPVDEAAFRALGTLAKGGLLTATSLDLETGGKELSFDRYETIGRFLGAMNRSCSWWIGDWLNYGEGVYGDRWGQATAATGLAEQTLINRAYVCRHVPADRRRATLPFSVHALVAALPAKEQAKWLDRAEKHAWTREDLREHMKGAKAEKDAKERVPPTNEPFAPALVLEAAKRVVGSAREYGPDYLVPREEMAKLRAAVGEEE